MVFGCCGNKSSYDTTTTDSKIKADLTTGQNPVFLQQVRQNLYSSIEINRALILLQSSVVEFKPSAASQGSWSPEPIAENADGQSKVTSKQPRTSRVAASSTTSNEIVDDESKQNHNSLTLELELTCFKMHFMLSVILNFFVCCLCDQIKMLEITYVCGF